MLSKEFLDKYISEEDCALYVPLTFRMFHFLNGTVNTIFKFPKFEIVPFATDFNTIGYSNNYSITIFLGNIIKLYDNASLDVKRDIEFRRHDYICSYISQTIIHELFHIDQIRYEDPNFVWRQIRGAEGYQIEGAVELRTEEFERDNYDLISRNFGFVYMFDAESVFHTIPFDFEYRQLDFETLFKQLLNTSVCVNDYGKDNIDRLDYFGSDDNITMIINDWDGMSRRIPIKINGAYIEYGLYELVDFIDYYHKHLLNGTKQFVTSPYGVELIVNLQKDCLDPLISIYDD